MKKATVEFRRYRKHPTGYGLMYPPSEQEILDFLVEWSKLNPDAKIYRHLSECLQDFETNTYEDKYKPFNGERGHQEIPYCDLVYYITIYHQ